MAVREILQIGNPVLKQRSHKITRFDGALPNLVEDMFETMHAADGLGLAAPQIGIPRRLIVLEMPDDESYPHPGERFVMCNPEIVKASRETAIGQEGCLSVAGYVGMVERAEQVIIRAQDLKGRKFRVKAEGFLARAFQHEIDHLNGTLYVEIAEPGSVMTLEEHERQVREQQAAAEAQETEEAEQAGEAEETSIPI
jgi:peptide deformylase